MPRRRRTEKAKPHSDISDGMMAYLTDEPIAESDSETVFKVCMLSAGSREEGLRELWKSARSEVLATWISKNPGTRPRVWWQFDAPRQPLGRFPGCFWDGELPEPRKFISGAGCDASLISAYMPSYESGLPTAWAGYEAADPPVFESQAAYLSRHGLLTASEKRVLIAADYERTEALTADCEVLSASEEWVRQRIPAARKGLGLFDCQQSAPY